MTRIDHDELQEWALANLENTRDGWTQWLAREVVALLDENAELRAALIEAKSNLQWSTGGWGQATEEVLKPARVTLAGYLAAIDKALGDAS